MIELCAFLPVYTTMTRSTLTTHYKAKMKEDEKRTPKASIQTILMVNHQTDKLLT